MKASKFKVIQSKVICDIPKIKWHKVFPKNRVTAKLDCDKLRLDPNTKIK